MPAALVGAFAFAGQAAAQTPDPTVKDPNLEVRPVVGGLAQLRAIETDTRTGIDPNAPGGYFACDITGSETLLFGENFGVTPDVETSPDETLYVVSLSRGTVYEIRKR